MRLLCAGTLAIFNLAGLCTAEDFLDRVDEALTISAFGDQVRARLSGTLDLEGYYAETPAPGLIFSPQQTLFNPRLTLFLDAQLGDKVYVFGQARVDRGFDPSEQGAQLRLDEYAIRITPWKDGRFNLQVGQFATIVGNWAPRHGSWDNPFITAPLPYENLTGIWDSEPAHSARELFSWSHVNDGSGGFYGDEYSDKHLRQPIVWGPSYTSGIAVFGRIGKFDYALDVKNSALSSRPEYWGAQKEQWQHPTVSARLGFRPSEMWNLGVSGSVGPYLNQDAILLGPGYSLRDYRQITLAQDFSFAWHQWQIWAEFYEARFEIPTIGNADTFAYYLETKYKFTPQFFGALRWNQQLFNRIDGQRWGRETWRIDTSAGYRFTPHTQLKLQHSFQKESNAPQSDNHILGVQFTVRF